MEPAQWKPENENLITLKVEKYLTFIHEFSRFYLTFAFLDRIYTIGNLAMPFFKPI